MKSFAHLYLVFLICFSCIEKQEKTKHHSFYYPNKELLLKHKNSPYLTLDLFKSTDDLLDSLSILNYQNSNAVFQIRDSLIDYTFIVKYLNHPEGPPTMIKSKNLLGISNDSIFKFKSSYPIDSLCNVLKKDMQNYGYDSKYSDSPKDLFIVINDSINKLKSPLVKLFKCYNVITSEINDPPNLNIAFSEHVDKMRNLEKELKKNKIIDL